MQFSLQRWIRISLFNLLLVASIGVILRYKIAFALPFIDQKHLLHGHSHFAFAGWVTQALMVLLVSSLAVNAGVEILRKYNWILLANLVTAYGMLLSFPIQGYGSFSILFSTLSVFVSYVFAVMYWVDLNRLQNKNIAKAWYKAALLFNVISSLGVFALATMMVTKTVHQNWYLVAEYFYLHFQYNGWFFFACMGLLAEKLVLAGFTGSTLKMIFRLFVTAFIPAYFLSVLWMNLPVWIYVIIVLAAFAQVAGWAWLLRSLYHERHLLKVLSPVAQSLFKLSGIALSIKLLLQLGSVIPSLSDLSYGFRPIIIGYLHLVLLGIITIYILGHMVADKLISISKITITGLVVFISGIITNEILLMVHGIASLNYNMIPFINEMLFGAAFVMFEGLVIINMSQQNKVQK
ncbi:MAG: hypothetical protein ABIO04_10025 [Ferruginibacter sp.]